MIKIVYHLDMWHQIWPRTMLLALTYQFMPFTSDKIIFGAKGHYLASKYDVFRLYWTPHEHLAQDNSILHQIMPFSTR